MRTSSRIAPSVRRYHGGAERLPLLQRPDRLRVERHGAFAESEQLFAGTKVQLAVVEPPMVAEVPVQGEIEAAIRALRY